MNLENITIEQLMRLQLIVDTYKEDENKLNAEIVKYIYGTLDVSKIEADKTLLDVINIINSKPDFIQRFEFNGVEYGFIPNLNNISVAEFIDLDQYVKDGKQLHKIAAILFRPITKKNGKFYDIEKYEGTSKYADLMLNVDHKIVLGALVFFWNLGNSLLESSIIYTQKMTKKLEKIKTKQNS